MPFLVVLGAFCVWCGIGIANKKPGNEGKIPDPKRMNEMLNRCAGKDEKECRKIQKKYF